MKTKLLAASLLLAALIPQNSAHAQSTAFTYQGRLNDGAGPANGSYDLTFALFSVSSGAGQVGSTLTSTATAVSNGLFTVTLDFGSQFPGANRWLEIGVRTNAGGAFSTLSPRQPLTPAPYAIYATSAGNAATATTAASATSSATATTATNFSGALSGNVTGTQSATVVATVGGVTAANVGSGANAANAATSANTANTIVARDASGNFSAGKLTLASTLDLPSTTATAGSINFGGNPFIHTYGGNFFAGFHAGNFTMGGAGNIGIGQQALNQNTSGNQNTAVGSFAMENNGSGYFNTALGYGALDGNTSGTENTAVGDHALFSNTFGAENTAVGEHALNNNTFGLWNTAVGGYALQGVTSGQVNIALGYGAGNGLTSGNYNICIGNSGLAGDSNIIRIGTPGVHTTAAIAGVISGNGGGLTNTTTAANYVFGCDTNTQAVTNAPNFQDVQFSTDVQISGWTHTAGSAFYTNAQTGLYLVQYTGEAQVGASGITISMLALVNSSAVSGSQAAITINGQSSVALTTSVISKSFIASLAASDTLRLQLTASGNSAQLNPTGSTSSGGIKPSVSMTIVRIQ